MSNLYREVVKKAIRAEDTSSDNKVEPKLTCLNVDCPERTGGKCNARPLDSLDSKIDAILQPIRYYADIIEIDEAEIQIKALILSERSEADRLGRIRKIKRISTNHSYYGCPMCDFHSSAFEIDELTQQSNGGK